MNKFIDPEETTLDGVITTLKNIKFSCYHCKHFRENETCKAFPKGIIEDIMIGQIRHDKVHPMQKGDTIFERDDK